MRISNAQITAMMHGSMNTSSEKLGKLMQQMATGERMLMPSDDPISAVRVLRIQREEATLTQYRTNIANVSGNLSKQEPNLKAASDTMLNVRDLLLWAANGSNTSEDLAAIANEMGNLERTILSFANVRDEEGRYLFSGTLSDRPAITFDAATQSYGLTGNDQYRQAAVANGVLVEENVTAAQVFGGGVGMLNDLNTRVKMLADPALDANDLWYQVNASWDYDPSADLERMTAPTTWINSADDFINPPELGLAEQFVPRIAGVRYRLVPNSPGGKGHGTHTWAEFWRQDLIDLLARSER